MTEISDEEVERRLEQLRSCPRPPRKRSRGLERFSFIHHQELLSTKHIDKMKRKGLWTNRNDLDLKDF